MQKAEGHEKLQSTIRPYGKGDCCRIGAVQQAYSARHWTAGGQGPALAWAYSVPLSHFLAVPLRFWGTLNLRPSMAVAQSAFNLTDVGLGVLTFLLHGKKSRDLRS